MESTVHWSVVRNKSGNYYARAGEQHDARVKYFRSKAEAVDFVETMKSRTLGEQRAWIAGRARGSGGARKYSTVGRMKTEWARTHRQVLVVGGWRGRPCGGGNVGVRSNLNPLVRAD